jgi:hypothetical protein
MASIQDELVGRAMASGVGRLGFANKGEGGGEAAVSRVRCGLRIAGVLITTA